MEIILKRFEELDIEEIYEILKLRAEVFVVEQNCPYQDCDGKDKNSYHIFIKEDNIILGYLRVIDKGISYDETSIGRVVVNPKYRGQGIARKLMMKALEFIDNSLREEVIKISAQEYLLNFYKSLGFVKVSDVYLEDGIPHIEMVR